MSLSVLFAALLAACTLNAPANDLPTLVELDSVVVAVTTTISSDAAATVNNATAANNVTDISVTNSVDPSSIKNPVAATPVAVTMTVTTTAMVTKPPPPPVTVTVPTECTLHVIARGETVFGIAQLYGVNFRDMMTLNNVDDIRARRIRPGEMLLVPSADCTLSAGDIFTPPPPTRTPSPTPLTTDTLTPSPTFTRTPGPTRAATVQLPIVDVRGPFVILDVINPGDLDTEAVILRNDGGISNLEGWMLRDGDGNEYRFPNTSILPGDTVTVNTRAGQNRRGVRFWGQSQAVFNNGDGVILLDVAGAVHSVYRVS